MEALPAHPDALKACCAALYQSDWARLLLGDSFHPGGLALTERCGELLGLRPGVKLVDVASGAGTSALHLAQVFGCGVTGVDYGSEAVAAATQRAEMAGLGGRVQFEEGDAEDLPFEAGAYDAALCECALCTFPDKQRAAGEFGRILRPGGMLVVSDVVIERPLAPELDSLLGWVACIAAALPTTGYVQLIEGAGLKVRLVEPHPEALRALTEQIKMKLLGAELLVKLGKVTLPGTVSIQEATQLARAALREIEQGALGYTLFLAQKL